MSENHATSPCTNPLPLILKMYTTLQAWEQQSKLKQLKLMKNACSSFYNISQIQLYWTLTMLQELLMSSSSFGLYPQRIDFSIPYTQISTKLTRIQFLWEKHRSIITAVIKQKSYNLINCSDYTELTHRTKSDYY